jgi:hypothetical protein
MKIGLKWLKPHRKPLKNLVCFQGLSFVQKLFRIIAHNGPVEKAKDELTGHPAYVMGWQTTRGKG